MAMAMAMAMTGVVKASPPLRVFVFPLMSPGHMIPTVDIAMLFARHGAAVTVITTPRNEPLIRPVIGSTVDIILIHFPDSVAHLVPDAGEHLGAIPSAQYGDFMAAAYALADPFNELLRRHRPDCLVHDYMFHFASVADGMGIPRLVFHGHGALPLCAHRSIELRRPQDAVSSADERFVVEDLPGHLIRLAASEVSPIFEYAEMIRRLSEAEAKSFGILVNTFYELEPACADHLRKETAPKAYLVGPVALCNRPEEQTHRGERSSADLGRWLEWLDTKSAGSVVYVSFGSICEFSPDQLKDLALGLEASGHPFVWVVRGGSGGPPAEWMPEGYERRVEGRGLVIRGWAPQVALLTHSAVGGFVTHCGWNSTLEGLTAGKPMAAWPLGYEQFINEQFLTELTGVGVRVRRREAVGGEAVTAEEVAAAVRELMSVEEAAEKRRRRAREYAAKAKSAMEEGGSSYEDMRRLVEELRERRQPKSEGSAKGGDGGAER